MKKITRLYDKYVIARNRRDCYKRGGYNEVANLCQKEMNSLLKHIQKHNDKVDNIGGFKITIDMSRHNIDLSKYVGKKVFQNPNIQG